MKWSWAALAVALTLVGVLLTIEPPVPSSGTFPVEVIGPDGRILATNVTLEDATAYLVLRDALEAAGIEHEAQGAGESLLVTSIAGHDNAGAGGWCFDVWDQGWHRPALGAGVFGLHPGQATRWVYESDGCGAFG